MTLWVFALICIICGCLWAYTRGVQEATLFWGKQASKGNELLPATGMQDAITPPGQNTRNIIMILSMFALPILGVYYLDWGIGIGGFIGAFAVQSILRAFLPKVDSGFFFGVILRGLADRRAKFARESDEIRVEAIDEIIQILKGAFAEHHGKSAPL